jgi:hypothetical protein
VDPPPQGRTACRSGQAAAIGCGRGQAQRAKDLISVQPLCTVLHSMSPPPRAARPPSGPLSPAITPESGVNPWPSAMDRVVGLRPVPKAGGR